MARIRTIKPEFFTSPDTAKASIEARLFYIAMWCWADDYGVGETNFNALLGFAFPEDDQRERKEIQSLCKEVADSYDVTFYDVDGRHFYEIPSWNEHQRTQRRAERRNPPSDHAESSPDLRIYQMQGRSVPTQGSSAPPQGESSLGTGEQGNIGTGEREQGNSEPKGSASPATAQTLVGEWIDHCNQRPPGRVIGQVSKEIKAMIDEGIPDSDLRAGLAAWHSKNLHPSTLASVVHETRNPTKRLATTDLRVSDGLALAAEFRTQEQARLEA